MTGDAVVTRARSVLNTATYRLGAGGINPHAASPRSIDGCCDCSGFVSWVLGISRKTDNPFYMRQNGGWIETTAVYEDILTPAGLFVRSVPHPGAILVYGDHGGHQGHIAIVSAVKDGNVDRIIHCSISNPPGHAIAETPPIKFDGKDALIGWYIGLENPSV